MHLDWALPAILTVPIRTGDATAAKSNRESSPLGYRRQPTRTPHVTDRRSSLMHIKSCSNAGGRNRLR